MDPPVVPSDLLADWRRVEDTTQQPVSWGPISVTVRTVRFAPPPDVEPRPYFFASRLDVVPKLDVSPLLTKLIRRGARHGFRTQLAEQNVAELVERREDDLRIDDPNASTAKVVTYHGLCAVADGSIPVEATLAVWEAGDYLLAGGVYPRDDAVGGTRSRVIGLVRAVTPR